VAREKCHDTVTRSTNAAVIRERIRTDEIGAVGSHTDCC